MTIWESLRLDGHPEDIPNYGAHIAIEMHEPVGQLSIKVITWFWQSFNTIGFQFFLSMGFNQTRVELHPHFCSRSQNNDCTWDEFQRLVKVGQLHVFFVIIYNKYKFQKSRKPKSDWIFECQGYEKATEPVSALTGSENLKKYTWNKNIISGSMIVLLSILILSTIILGFTTFSYKRQLNALRDPERTRLL